MSDTPVLRGFLYRLSNATSTMQRVDIRLEIYNHVKRAVKKAYKNGYEDGLDNCDQNGPRN